MTGNHHPQRELIVHRQVEHAVQATLAVVAHREIGLTCKTLDWLVGDQIDGACGRIATIKRALRAAQHLHPLQVVEGCASGLGPTQVHTVDVECRRRITDLSGVGAANAANRNIGGRCTAWCNLHVGNQVGQPHSGGRPRTAQIIASHRGERERGFGRGLCDFLRCHGDVCQATRLHRGRVGGTSSRGSLGAGQAGHAAQKRADSAENRRPRTAVSVGRKRHGGSPAG